MLRELYQAQGLPVLQNTTFADPASARASASGNMRLVQDDRTGLVFNDAFDPGALAYDSDYQNEQAHSVLFQRHLQDVENIITRHFSDQTLIEVGCGKGYFLEQLLAKGVAITGIDPAYEGDNPAIIKQAFRRELGLAADGLILRHVLEHIQSPVDFLQAMAKANEGGRIYIEVPCLNWILEHRAWFDLFYEHVNYFRLEDLCAMFGSVQEAGHLFGGQYLYVVADLASLGHAKPLPPKAVEVPDDFTLSLQRAIAIVRADPSAGHAIWGASSKGVIYSLFLQRAGVAVDQIVDINPAKQGRYLPLSGLKVSSPTQALEALPDGAHVFVMNSNYLEEIQRMTFGRFRYYAVDSASFRDSSESAQ